ncbi:MAG: DUF456 domain-containing protein [Chloroflexota bacterium]
MGDFQQAVEAFIAVVTFIVLVMGLLGLLIPVFPGLTVMWLGTLVYALVQASNDQMNWIGWTLFAFITMLMLIGNVIDNIIIAKHVRDNQVPWSSILLAFGAGLITSIFFTPIVGIVAAPTGLYLAELRRVQDRNVAFANTKAWMTGWGWSIAARIGIGILMIILWVVWAWL